MSYLGKVFKFEKQDNYDGFIKSLGLPEDKAQILLKAAPNQKLTKNGGDYTLHVIAGERFYKVFTFKNGAEFNEKIAELGAKSTMKVAGDTFTHVQRFSNGHVITLSKEFSNDELKETITTNFWYGNAIRYFSAQTFD